MIYNACPRSQLAAGNPTLLPNGSGTYGCAMQCWFGPCADWLSKTAHAGITVQEFIAAARSIVKGLDSLHSQQGVFLDVRAANICWRTQTAHVEAVMVDVSTCGKEGCKPTIMLKDWVAKGTNRTLNRAGCYDKASDMRQLVVMLRKLCFGQQWSSNCTAFCAELAAKRLSAAQALQHLFLRSEACELRQPDILPAVHQRIP